MISKDFLRLRGWGRGNFEALSPLTLSLSKGDVPFFDSLESGIHVSPRLLDPRPTLSRGQAFRGDDRARELIDSLCRKSGLPDNGVDRASKRTIASTKRLHDPGQRVTPHPASQAVFAAHLRPSLSVVGDYQSRALLDGEVLRA